MTKQKFNSLGLKVPVVEGEAQKGEAQEGEAQFKTTPVMQKYTFQYIFRVFIILENRLISVTICHIVYVAFFSIYIAVLSQ